MRTISNDKTVRYDKWLLSLVDAMDEVELLRADDVCRGAYAPAGLMAQLASNAGRPTRIAAPRFAFA